MRREPPAELVEMMEAMRAATAYRPDLDQPPTVLSLPFRGPWLAVNTPARRVPSHGTHFLGQSFAIDFVAVDTRGRASTSVDWRTVPSDEPNDRFVGFDAPILAPADATVVAAHDGEPDHTARRSPLTVLPYLLTQGSRLRRGLDALVGNHLILALADSGPYILLAHLRRGSVQVDVGDLVQTGQTIGACGNSGNSTQPHLHVQVMDTLDLLRTRGLPMEYRDYLEWPRGAKASRHVDQGVPGHRARVQPAA